MKKPDEAGLCEAEQKDQCWNAGTDLLKQSIFDHFLNCNRYRFHFFRFG